MSARTLELHRSEPGVVPSALPVGLVAEAVVFTDGTSVLHWLTEPCGIEIYATESAMRGVRESSGRSRFVEVTA